MAATEFKLYGADAGDLAGCFRLTNVRLSYPHLFSPWAGSGVGDDGKPNKPKFSGKFLINLADSKPAVVAFRNYILQYVKDEGKGLVLPADRLCLRNGSGSGKPEQEGHWVFAASENTRPTVVGLKNEPLAEADGVIYGGCYVAVVGRLWLQGVGKNASNKFGKRANANLLSVKFMRDGEAFSEAGPRPDVAEAFGDLASEEADSIGDGLGEDDDLG